MTYLITLLVNAVCFCIVTNAVNVFFSSDIADSLRTRVHAIVRNLEKKASKPKVRNVLP